MDHLKLGGRPNGGIGVQGTFKSATSQAMQAWLKSGMKPTSPLIINTGTRIINYH